MAQVECACGCGEYREAHVNGKDRRYIPGHHNRNRSNWWKIVAQPSARTHHRRAAQLKSFVDVCEWQHIGDCRGPLQVAHVNQNELDNSVENLLKLCNRHHSLLDHGRIDPQHPVMPPYHVFPSGRRIYDMTHYRPTPVPDVFGTTSLRESHSRGTADISAGRFVAFGSVAQLLLDLGE